jgi:hypothetical protein
VHLSVTGLYDAYPKVVFEDDDASPRTNQHQLDAFDRPFWSPPMALGWLAAWLAATRPNLERAKTIVRHLSRASADTADVCFHARLEGSDYPDNACEHLVSAAAEGRLIGTGVPFHSTTEIREQIMPTSWRASRMLTTRVVDFLTLASRYDDGRKVVALFSGPTPLYRDILLPARTLRVLWPFADDPALDPPSGLGSAPALGGIGIDVRERNELDRATHRRRGRTRNPLWNACRRDALNVLDLNGLPSRDREDMRWCQADFERWIHDWWMNNRAATDNLPSESHVREYATTWMLEYSERTS